MSVSQESISNPLHIVESDGIDFLTREEEEKLFSEYQASGDDSVGDRIFFHYSRLVPPIARSYEGKGLELFDIAQEGYAGLIKAIRDFKLEKGVRFSTFATPLVNQAISKALMYTSRHIRIPQDIVYRMRNVIDCEVRYFNEHGHLPDDNVLRELSGLTHATFKIVQHARKVYISYSVDQMIQESMNPGVDGRGDVETRLGLVTDELRISHEAVLELSRLLRLVGELRRFASKRLSKRSRDILFAYYGFNDPEFRRESVESIGQRYNITPKQVETIRKNCVQKIKKSLPGFQISDLSEERWSALVELSLVFS